jgi:methyl-accepting chemotaxis protein
MKVALKNKKTSLKTKTRWIFAVLLLGLLTVSAVMINRLSSVIDQSSIMSTEWFPRSRVVEQLSDAASAYRISEAVRILSVTPEMAAHADQDIADNADLFKTKLADYRRRLRPHEAAAPIDNVQALWDSYLSGNQQMLALARDGKTEDAADRYRNSASKFYLLTDALTNLSDYNAAQSAQAGAKAKKMGQIAIYITIGVLVLVYMRLLMASIFFETKVWRLLVGLSDVMQKLAKGDFTAEVEGTSRTDEVGDMARAVQVFKDNGLEMQRLEAQAESQRIEAEDARRKHDEAIAAAAASSDFVVSQIAAGLADLSTGDLTLRLDEEFAPQFEKLRCDFNAAVENLRETMTVISQGAAGIHSSTQEISQASDNLARRTEKQAASLEEVAASLEQLTQTVRTSADGAKQAKIAVASAKANAERSGEVVRSAVAAMSEIERSARQISEIIGVMDEIAFQTNLLALNAGVEAARAGEAGRGFAVVAQEVRALAQRSTLAAKEIKLLISSSGEQVSAGVGLVGETGKALDLIAAQVAEINGAVGEIALAADDQAAGLLQINASVSQMDRGTQQNAAMAEESTAASHSLAQETNELARLIARFNLGTPQATAGVRQPRLIAADPPRDGAARQARSQTVLKTLSSGNAALATSLENAISEDGWEEF